MVGWQTIVEFDIKGMQFRLMCEESIIVDVYIICTGCLKIKEHCFHWILLLTNICQNQQPTGCFLHCLCSL